MKIWKHVGHDLHGYGNGYKAVIYEYVFTNDVTVLVHKGDNEINRHVAPSLAAGKRWAERHYLKGKK